jgi:antitoxin VapB
MTETVIDALTSELQRIDETTSLAERLAVIASDLAAQAKPGGHEMRRDEIDAMWGHS